MLVKVQSAISLFTCGCLVSVAASPSSIGFVVTSGQAQVDGSAVHGNSTLFQGSEVQAGELASDLMFPGGSNLLLQPGSAVKVYREHAVLERGAVIQRGNQGYALVADGLKISTLSQQGAVVVGLKDSSHLEVTAQGGGLRSALLQGFWWLDWSRESSELCYPGCAPGSAAEFIANAIAAKPAGPSFGTGLTAGRGTGNTAWHSS